VHIRLTVSTFRSSQGYLMVVNFNHLKSVMELVSSLDLPDYKGN